MQRVALGISDSFLEAFFLKFLLQSLNREKSLVARVSRPQKRSIQKLIDRFSMRSSENFKKIFKIGYVRIMVK